MANYQSGQGYSNMRWGTRMPVTVKVGSEIVQVRARGSYAFTITDPARVSGAEPDPECLPDYLRPRIILAVTDLLGERSMSASTRTQFTQVTPQMDADFKAGLERLFTQTGLALTSASIEAIEIL